MGLGGPDVGVGELGGGGTELGHVLLQLDDPHAGQEELEEEDEEGEVR